MYTITCNMSCETNVTREKINHKPVKPNHISYESRGFVSVLTIMIKQEKERRWVHGVGENKNKLY